MLGLTVIVPLLNERNALPVLVFELEAINAQQLIVVDGGSTDGSAEWLEEHWADSSVTEGSTNNSSSGKLLLRSIAGRAFQMNAGAEFANQPLLLFLHADTSLPANAKSLLSNALARRLEPNKFWGRFDIQFDSTAYVMRVIALFINHRSRISGIATGDQAIFVSQQLFDEVAGFDDLGLMEDVALSKKLRRRAKPLCVNEKATTSARRWQANGVIKTVVSMWWYRLLFFCGTSPERFAKHYRNIR